jgi:hypothetical protein
VSSKLVFREDASGCQSWGFGRSHQYLAAALYESNLDSETLTWVTERVGEEFREGTEHAKESH